MDPLILIANLLYVLSYFVQDILRLRVLTIIAATILVAYFLLLPEPLMQVVYWNVFFIWLNIFQLSRIFYQRRRGYDPLLQVIARVRKAMLGLQIVRTGLESPTSKRKIKLKTSKRSC